MTSRKFEDKLLNVNNALRINLNCVNYEILKTNRKYLLSEISAWKV